MALLLQSPELGLTGTEAFALEARNLGGQWQPDQLSWGQLEPLDLPLDDEAFDFLSISASPEAVRIRRNMSVHAHSGSMATVVPRLSRMSILDFPRLDLGAVLRPLGPDDDILGEMLDEAWP